MKRPLAIILIIIGIIALGGVTYAVITSQPKTMTMESTSTQDMEPEMAPNTINIKDFAFSPETLTIKKGTTVTWTNQDDARHDITPVGDASDFERSELLEQGESYGFTFNNVGTYEYICSPHPYMTGTIEVTE